MATCNNFKINILNRCDAYIKVKKFEYKDGDNWKTENIFGLDGYQKLEANIEFSITRDLGGIEDESTKFRVTYCLHAGGNKWLSDKTETTDSFTAHDNGSKTVTLT